MGSGRGQTRRVQSRTPSIATLVIGEKGQDEWRLDEGTGPLHYEYGPAVEFDDFKAWYINGQRHREDGPAIEYADGKRTWWVHGQRHREDGPAIIQANGAEEYWLHGKKVDKEEVEKLIGERFSKFSQREIEGIEKVSF